jgi:hypothetical protein
MFVCDRKTVRRIVDGIIEAGKAREHIVTSGQSNAYLRVGTKLFVPIADPFDENSNRNPNVNPNECRTFNEECSIYSNRLAAMHVQKKSLVPKTGVVTVEDDDAEAPAVPALIPALRDVLPDIPLTHRYVCMYVCIGIVLG